MTGCTLHLEKARTMHTDPDKRTKPSGTCILYVELRLDDELLSTRSEKACGYRIDDSAQRPD